MKTPKLQLSHRLVLLVALWSIGAQAQITPSGDAYTNSATPTTNYGAKTLIDVDGATQASYIQFDLGSIPSGANVSQATLKLYVNSVVTAGSFNVDYVNGSWSEGTIDFNNAPALGSNIVASVPITTADKNQFVLINITSALQAWLNGSQTNDGIALVANGSFNATFDSKENTTTSHPAEIDVVYAPGGGTITGITTAGGSGLMGGGTSGTLNLSLTNACAANQVLQWNGNSWVCASVGTGTITGVAGGAGLLGGGTSGNVTLTVDPTQVPFLNTANTFTGNQTVNGNLSATGLVTGSGFQIGSQLVAFGSYANENAFLGFAGNTTTTGTRNAAVGYQALLSNTSGWGNTAAGTFALLANTTGGGNVANGAYALSSNTTGTGNTGEGDGALDNNTTGSYNTGDGAGALIGNTTGESNTAGGYDALLSNTTGNNNTAFGFVAGNTTNATQTTGSNNTFLGTYANPGTQTNLNNATAVGAFAQVTTSNSMVLGSINGVNSATASTNVGIGTTAPAFTLDVHGTGNFTGQVSFASGQTFPGTGTVTSVGSGAGLTGGPITGSGSLSIATGGVTNAMLANSSMTVNPGTDLVGGGPVSLGGTTTLNVDTTKVPQLAAANVFTGNQTVNGNLSATGVVSGAVFNIGSTQILSISPGTFNLYAGQASGQGAGANNTGSQNTAAGYQTLFLNTTGSYNSVFGASALYSNTTGNNNTAVGSFALNANSTGGDNTAVGEGAMPFNTTGSQNTANGTQSLYSNTTGGGNTGVGLNALFSNTTGGTNTANGDGALYGNTTGSNNIASGFFAGGSADGSAITGSNNTLLGTKTALSTGTLNNAAAIGATAQVAQSNAMVLGSINGVNGATADTTVGIGTTTPVFSGLPDNSTTKLNIVGNNTYVPLVVQSPSTFGTWMVLNNTSSGGKPWAILSAASGNGEGAGNLAITDLGAGGTIFLEGNVHVSGNLSKGGGSFKIDHPLDPANKYLYHSFVESPDMMNIYNGNVVTDKQGLATVELPDWFEALNRDFRYQLTVIGQFAQAIVVKKVDKNRFTIKTNKPAVEVSWQVTGIRQDAYANAYRIPVEEMKPRQEQGHYLHPELFGAGAEKSLNADKNDPSPATVKQAAEQSPAID